MKKNEVLRSLPYYGGKSPVGNINKWINSIIGFDSKKSYIEPFAGMLGVLLSRKPVVTELVNDANGYVINWWRMVRDKPDELAALTHNTPWGRESLGEAIDSLENEKDDLRRALWFHIIIEQNVRHAISTTKSSISVKYDNNNGIAKWTAERFAPLADRLRRVQLENRDATLILERTKDIDQTILYCDPPYFTADTSPYGEFGQMSKEKFTELFLAQKGEVAISGYNDEWDHLGFVRSEKDVATGLMPNTEKFKTEVLWTNFEPRNNKIVNADEFFEYGDEEE